MCKRGGHPVRQLDHVGEVDDESGVSGPTGNLSEVNGGGDVLGPVQAEEDAELGCRVKPLECHSLGWGMFSGTFDDVGNN